MKGFFNKKIPTAFGLFLLLVAVLATSYLVNTGVIYLGGAAPSENPQDIRITNITDTSFTVTYKTEAKVIGTIVLNNDGKTQTVLDERDQQSGIPKTYTIHSIAVKNAKEKTSYTFSITSGATTYQNNGKLFSVATGPVITSSPSAQTPLSGKVLDENGNPAKDTLVLATTSNGQFLSTVSKDDGIYLLPLNAMRTSDFSQYVSLSRDSVLQLLLTNGSQNSQVQILIGNTNPVPVITLSNNYNFVTSPSPIASTAASFGFPPFPNDNSFNASPVITTPKKDQGFTDPQPQFSGKGLPNESVTIEIHSDAIVTATTTTDGFGNWTYRPTTPLSPGQHTISITTKNAAGILQTIQQSFTVFASGTQVTQSATPSGQLSPTPTTKPTPTATPVPTGKVSPTSATTLTPTSIPTPTKIVGSLTPRPTLPPTGNNSLIISSILGLATTLIGIVLFVFTKGVVL